MTDKKENKKLKFKCANCNEVEVEHEGEWCEDCDLPERSSVQ